MGILALPQYDHDDVTVGISSAITSYEGEAFLGIIRLLHSLVMTMLVDCWLLYSSSSCRAVDFSLDLLSESPINETGGVISRSIGRSPSGPLRESGSGGKDSIISSNSLDTLEIPLELI